LSNLLPKTLDV